jgi:hypothetical protein
MKYLKLDIHYKLPDDFEGDENDAIEHLLKYRRSEKLHKIDFIHDPNEDLYSNWWKMINTTDRVLFGKVSLSKLVDNEWETLNK